MSLKSRLGKAPIAVLAAYASILIFVIYTLVYAYRKPFSVGIYEGDSFWGVDAKILFVLAQIFGYAISKFIGIRVVPAMKQNRRGIFIFGLIAVSELALLGFATLPIPFKLVCLFFNGLPLGLIWGLIISYIEGRRISEILNVGLSTALIISSGLVKTLGKFIMDTFAISEYWMPFITGLVCFPLFTLCVWLLTQVPDPNEEDQAMRTKRAPMNKSEQNHFFFKYWFGIFCLVVFYGVLTVSREIRDLFVADIWKENGIEDAMIFTKTEIPITILVLVLMFLIVFIRKNRLALNLIYIVAGIGAFIMLGSSYFFHTGQISCVTWMILSGLGMYMGYIPFTFLIERLIASLRVVSTSLFILYLADSLGYLGSLGVFITKNTLDISLSWTNTLVIVNVFAAALALLTMLLTYLYFKKQFKTLTIISEEDEN